MDNIVWKTKEDACGRELDKERRQLKVAADRLKENIWKSKKLSVTPLETS